MQTKQRNFDWFSLVVGIVFVIAGIAAYMNPDDTLKFISICIGSRGFSQRILRIMV